MVSEKNREIVSAAEMSLSNPSAILHPAVAKMLEHNPSPEVIEKMMALQERWEANEAKKKYTIALVELKKALPPWIQRDKVVDYPNKTGGRTHYTHASLAGMMEAVLPHLTEHGFSLTWAPGSTKEGKVIVTAKLTHKGGHSETSTLEAPPDMSGTKSTAQGTASTITLLQRYSGLALLGLATADMEEPTPDGGDRSSAGLPPIGDKVDSARNLKALSALVKEGKTKEQIEKFLGKPVQKWTLADLNKLREWDRPPAPPPAEEPVEEVPHEEAPAEADPPADEGSLFPPAPPAEPKEGDVWEETVQVVEVGKLVKAAKGECFPLKLRHADDKITEHYCWHKPILDFAKRFAGKEELVSVKLAAKMNSDRSKLFANVEAMAESKEKPWVF